MRFVKVDICLNSFQCISASILLSQIAVATTIQLVASIWLSFSRYFKVLNKFIITHLKWGQRVYCWRNGPYLQQYSCWYTLKWVLQILADVIIIISAVLADRWYHQLYCCRKWPYLQQYCCLYPLEWVLWNFYPIEFSLWRSLDLKGILLQYFSYISLESLKWVLATVLLEIRPVAITIQLVIGYWSSYTKYMQYFDFLKKNWFFIFRLKLNLKKCISI